MSEGNLYLRMTIDVAVFEGTRGDRLMRAILKDGGVTATVPSEDGKSVERTKLHAFGIGEQQARKVMEAVIRGDIEFDEIRDIEDHSA